MKKRGNPEQIARRRALIRSIAITYSAVFLWIFLSGAVIVFNKYLLAYSGFPYPICLTMWHMFFCAALAIVLVKSGKVQGIEMDRATYIKAIVPIGACYALTLWVGNAAYLYLSVSFIQMLKALSAVAVFGVGCMFGTEKFYWPTFINMILVTIGVAIASYGELNLNVTGVSLQLVAIFAESIRLVLVQILLQSRGLKLNPITTLYYVAPCCCAFLTVPFAVLELEKLTSDPEVVINPVYMIANAGTAFCLNVSVFLLIGRTSALTMNVAGVVKDWMLICLSVWLFHSAVTKINIGGYLIAFIAVCWYNLRKLRAARAAAGRLSPRGSAAAADVEQKIPLVILTEPGSPPGATIKAQR